jgi:Response regulator of the LytR/AlgR family
MGAKMIKIAICDDCAEDREVLITQINEVGKKINNTLDNDFQIKEYSCGQVLLEQMREIAFDIIFLDIQMDGMDGNETAVKIREIDMNVVLVFFTGFVEPSCQTFEVQPFRYIMKNMDIDTMNKYIQSVLNKAISNANIPKLSANIGKKKIIVNAKDVLYIEKYGKGARIHLAMASREDYMCLLDNNGNLPDIRSTEKLNVIYEKLKRYEFGCPHNSYIINFNYLLSCEANTYYLIGVDSEFTISRSKEKEFHAKKNLFLSEKIL